MTKEEFKELFGKNANNMMEYLKNITENNNVEAIKHFKREVTKRRKEREQEKGEPKALLRKFTPKKIKEHLDKYVIGQDKAKKVLAVAAYKHVVRYSNFIEGNDDTPQKNNVLFVGPTGTGKTYLCQVLAKFLELPFNTIDLSKLSQAGYVGGSLAESLKACESINAEYTSEQSEFSIVLLDEIDKIAVRGDRGDNIGQGPVQHELLKTVEGSMGSAEANTNNCLFIASGAFGGEIKGDKLETEVTKSMGFGGAIDETTTKVTMNEQLIEYGLIPELVGRFQTGAALEELTEDNLVSILKNSKDSALINFEKFFKSEGLELKFTKQAVLEVAKSALSKGTGARALNNILEQVLADVQFEYLGSESNEVIKVTKASIKAAL